MVQTKDRSQQRAKTEKKGPNRFPAVVKPPQPSLMLLQLEFQLLSLLLVVVVEVIDASAFVPVPLKPLTPPLCLCHILALHPAVPLSASLSLPSLHVSVSASTRMVEAGARS